MYLVSCQLQKISGPDSARPMHLLRREERPNLIKSSSEHRAASGPWHVPRGGHSPLEIFVVGHALASKYDFYCVF